MAWLPVFFIYSAITISIEGLDLSRYLDKNNNSGSQRENKEQFSPLVQHQSVKGKISMHEPSTIEFIYKGQNKNIKAHKSTDQERYIYISNFTTINNYHKKNKTGTIRQSDSKDNFREIVNTNGSNTTVASKYGVKSFMRTFLQEDKRLFNKKEASITRSLPKYFYDLLPISAFPEELSELKEPIMLQTEKLKNDGVPVTQKTFQPMHIAGPMPFPQSIYAREFDLPFFD